MRFQVQRLDGLVDKPGRVRESFLPPEALTREIEQVVQPRIGHPAGVAEAWRESQAKKALCRIPKKKSELRRSKLAVVLPAR